MAEPMEAEGWYKDPYLIHEDRWFSVGTPTALVRDAGVEHNDPPPSQDAPSGPLVESDPQGVSSGPDDVRRVDDSPDYQQTAFDAAARFMGPN
jgi:hypothetical protein